MKINKELVQKLLENKNNNQDFTTIKALLKAKTKQNNDEDILNDLFENPSSELTLKMLEEMIENTTRVLGIEFSEFVNIKEPLGASNFESEKLTEEEEKALDVIMASPNKTLLACVAREAIEKLITQTGQPFLIGQTNRGLYAYFVDNMAEDIIEVCKRCGILIERDVE